MLNEMMHRPVVKPELVAYMRESQRPFPGLLGQLEKEANDRGVPVIPHETAVFLDFYLGLTRPQQILEIGTAIGFSASLMASQIGSQGHVTTIDRYDLMIQEAKNNFERLGLTDRITQLEGDAADILPKLEQSYDFIFMDSAKAKYIEFFPHCMRVLKLGGVLMVDDIFQGGTILQEESQIPRRVRKIHRRLNQFLDLVQTDPALKSTLLPLGDGVILIQKIQEKSYDYVLDQLK